MSWLACAAIRCMFFVWYDVMFFFFLFLSDVLLGQHVWSLNIMITCFNLYFFSIVIFLRFVILTNLLMQLWKAISQSLYEGILLSSRIFIPRLGLFLCCDLLFAFGGVVSALAVCACFAAWWVAPFVVRNWHCDGVCLALENTFIATPKCSVCRRFTCLVSQSILL